MLKLRSYSFIFAKLFKLNIIKSIILSCQINDINKIQVLESEMLFLFLVKIKYFFEERQLQTLENHQDFSTNKEKK